MTFYRETATDNNLTNERQPFDNIAEQSSENIHREESDDKHASPVYKNLISRRLAELRKEHHLSQQGLASLLQQQGYPITKNMITRIETNKRQVLDYEIDALCKTLNVHFNDLIDWELADHILKK